MKAKQYAIKQPMDHWKNQIWNKKIPRDNENENRMIQKLWDTEKAVLRRKFTVI